MRILLYVSNSWLITRVLIIRVHRTRDHLCWYRSIFYSVRCFPSGLNEKPRMKNWCFSAITNLLYFRQGTSFVTTFDTCVTYKFKHSHQRVAYFEYFKMAYFGYFIFLDLWNETENLLLNQWHDFKISKKSMSQNHDFHNFKIISSDGTIYFFTLTQFTILIR